MILSHRSLITTFAAAILVVLPRTSVRAVTPSDQLMAPTTRGFVSIGDLQQLSDNFSATQFGQLVEDEAMQPFVQDMKRQLQRKLSSVRDKLGLELGDLKDVASGEVGLGMVEREGARAAVIMTVDISEREAAAAELMEKVDKELLKRRAKKSQVDVGDVEFTVYAIPPQAEDDVAREAVFFMHDGMLIGTDEQAEAKEIIGRMRGDADGGLTGAKPYQVTMQRCAAEAGDLQPDLRWYVDPFGYARAVRSLGDATKRRGKDFLKILTDQGFDAIQGVGGFVNLSVYDTYEILHRTSVFVPPVEGAKDKYRLAMRMLKFPNSDELQPQPWMPRKLAGYRTFNVDLENAFDNVDTLFDAIAVQKGAFDAAMEGFEVDPYGPQIRVRKDFIQHLGQRLTIVTDYEVPITTESERFLFVIDVQNQDAVTKAVQKFMDAEPGAKKTNFEGHIVWEITEPEDDIEDLEIGVIDVDPFGPAAADPVAGGAEGGVAQNSAVCVAEGHLMIASHSEFLREVLSQKPAEDSLAAAGDFNEVADALRQLLSGPICAHCFIRTDEAYRPTYELLRQGKMPESRTLLGRMLNRMLTREDDEDEGILREQKIDARALPKFEMVRRYFSPAGTLVRSEEDGWLVVGATLSKRTGQARAVGADGQEVSKVR